MNTRPKSPEAGTPHSSTRRAYTVNEFCHAYRLSRALYYKLQRGGRGPRVKKLGTRSIITLQAAQDWEATT